MKSSVVALAALLAMLSGCAPHPGEAELAEIAFKEGARYERGPGAADRSGPVDLAGEASLPPGRGVSDYLAYAALKNPGLEAAFRRWQAALDKVPQARALPDAKLTFGLFVREVETRAGPQRAKLGVMQPLPGRGKLSARAEVALREAEVARARYDAAKLSLFHRVESAYREYWYLSRAIEVTGENFELLKQLEGVARSKYAAGTAQSSALTKVQVELGKLEERIAELRDLRVPRSAALEAALGREPGGDLLPWPSAPPAPPADKVARVPSFERLMSLLRERNPDVERARLEAARAEAASALAGLSRRPDFGAGLDYIFTGDAAMAVPESGKDPVVLAFSMTLPFGKAKYRAAEREAEAMASAAERSLEEVSNGLAAALKLALFEYRDARRKVDLYRGTLIPKARQALGVARRAFEADRASFLDLIDAYRTLLEFELAQARATADGAVSLSRLNTLVGSDVLQGEEEVEEERKGPADGSGSPGRGR